MVRRNRDFVAPCHDNSFAEHRALSVLMLKDIFTSETYPI